MRKKSIQLHWLKTCYSKSNLLIHYQSKEDSKKNWQKTDASLVNASFKTIYLISWALGPFSAFVLFSFSSSLLLQFSWLQSVLTLWTEHQSPCPCLLEEGRRLLWCSEVLLAEIDNSGLGEVLGVGHVLADWFLSSTAGQQAVCLPSVFIKVK